MAAAHLLPRAEAALRQELQRLAAKFASARWRHDFSLCNTRTTMGFDPNKLGFGRDPRKACAKGTCAAAPLSARLRSGPISFLPGPGREGGRPRSQGVPLGAQLHKRVDFGATRERAASVCD
jgi:hypothetical protein